MNTLEDVLVYFTQKYPYKHELSNARLTKMVYLADWLRTLRKGKRLTDIDWYFDNYGPFVWDIKNVVEASDKFEIHHTTNFFGGDKKEIRLIDDEASPVLSKGVRGILDHVIEQTKPLKWAEFIKLIYSTYPVAASSKYSYLDLEALAKKYKREDA